MEISFLGAVLALFVFWGLFEAHDEGFEVYLGLELPFNVLFGFALGFRRFIEMS